MTTVAPVLNVEDGQFDDAPEDVGYARIDDTELIDLTSDEDEDEYDDDSEEYDQVRVEDEDWEVAEKDFTKQYNRLRQHLAVRSGSATSTATTPSKSAGGKGSNVAVLPAVNHPSQSTAARKAASTVAKDQTASQLALLSSKYGSRIANMDNSLGVGVNRKGASAHANIKDKADRATTEQVLDARTRVVLLKMVGRGIVAEINGCVSTGKEANVYHGVAREPVERELALKIYKTSILIFKDRDRYVAGEHRFRRGYARHNPRKMVRMWAEKEMRNLKRLRAAGVRCPEPVEVRENVLVMEFLGEASQASPRLKDAESEDGWEGLYVELMLTIRTIYHQCRLVHADLSEYNLLLHQGHVWIIDVGQSVEHDHPSAFDFLRSDLSNVEAFFGRRGVTVLGLRKSFGWVTNEVENEETLRKLMSEPEEEKDDGAFKHSYIPRRLDDVYDPERDIEEGRVLEAVATAPADDEQAADVDEGSAGDTPEDDEDEEQDREKRPRGHRHEDRDAKKERKKAVKAEARERRVQKKERKKAAGH
ncbi:related to extragenic suppressor of the bimD6 mutation [Armillaria ostoyae]|uniref:Serine/threonine-protein kinase RIO1 n=1 Tax=Armillaria ostoyae TaxID=47428 RepID=A0A284R4W8_ARMOS|nr:related to extragenic suppressor of the bimD6 mutation [Armillaria ostoyae]